MPQQLQYASGARSPPCGDIAANIVRAGNAAWPTTKYQACDEVWNREAGVLWMQQQVKGEHGWRAAMRIHHSVVADEVVGE